MNPHSLLSSTSSTTYSLFESSSQIAVKKISLNELADRVSHSKTLIAQQQKSYLQMINCVARFGIDNDLELFNAADYCFDFDFGPKKYRNITTIHDYLMFMEEDVKKTLGENDLISPDYFTQDRLGFFILTPDFNVYFLKSDDNETIQLYSAQKDDFIESASLPLSGQEKLIILNKSKLPLPEAYYSTPTPTTAAEGKFYHEKQDGVKCGIHASHAFVGFPFISDTQLSMMRLEDLAKRYYDGEITTYNSAKYSANHVKPSLNSLRFSTAQSKDYQADLGNSSQDILKILHHMAEQKVIDEKYSQAKLYSIEICESDVEYAKKQGLFSTEQKWDTTLTEAVLKAVNNDLTQNYDQKDASSLIHAKNRLEMTLTAEHALKRIFLSNDRLIVLSHIDKHTFTLRKFNNDGWVIIDSMNAEQKLINDPMKWLLERHNQFFQASGSYSYEFIAL